MANKKAPWVENHEKGTVKYEWLGDMYEVTVYHYASQNRLIDAFTRLTDARRLVVTLIGKRTS